MPQKRYTEDNVTKAVALFRSGMSVRNASEQCNVPKSTLMDRISDKHSGTQGRPSELTPEEEELIMERVKLMADWGFPFCNEDLRHFIKAYLDKKGTKTRFENNLPSRWFLKRFLGRHPEFTMRQTNSIKRSRAQLSREEVQAFFNNFAESVEGIPPENIFNFDESPLRDDPGSTRCIFKKGTKYCEKVQNTSKQDRFLLQI